MRRPNSVQINQSNMNCRIYSIFSCIFVHILCFFSRKGSISWESRTKFTEYWIKFKIFVIVIEKKMRLCNYINFNLQTRHCVYCFLDKKLISNIIDLHIYLKNGCIYFVYNFQFAFKTHLMKNNGLLISINIILCRYVQSISIFVLNIK